MGAFGSPEAIAMHESPAVNPDSIRASIAAALACEELRVRGDGHHFEALIVCAAFEGKTRVARHQLVYAALGDRMREEIHALSMLTMTPAEFAATRAQSLGAWGALALPLVGALALPEPLRIPRAVRGWMERAFCRGHPVRSSVARPGIP